MAKKEYLLGLATGVLLMGSIGAGAVLGTRAGRAESVVADRDTREKIQFLESMIDEYYLWDKNEDHLKEGIYTGLIYGLGDPYSRYYTAEEYQEENAATQGEYVGIGVVIQKSRKGGMQIVECYEGGPGELAGLKAGDRIREINGVDVTDRENQRSSGTDQKRGRVRRETYHLPGKYSGNAGNQCSRNGCGAAFGFL